MTQALCVIDFIGSLVVKENQARMTFFSIYVNVIFVSTHLVVLLFTQDFQKVKYMYYLCSWLTLPESEIIIGCM